LAGTGYTFPGSGYGGQLIYRTLYYVARTYTETDGQGRKVVREVKNCCIPPNDCVQVNDCVQPNDFLVTITSSKLPGFAAMPDQKRNHATIADEGMGNVVLNLIRSIQPIQ
jgi:hypothetical protein